MQNIETKRIKHLEACKKWRDNNREKYRKVSLNSIRRKKAKNPEEHLSVMNERSKRYRLNNIEACNERSRVAAQKRRDKDRPAYNLAQREYRKNNPEKFRKYYQEFKSSTRYKTKVRAFILKKYGLTQDSYESLLLQQSGKCAICTDTFEQTPHIDHCHKTGVVRGLLCSRCNPILGYIEKSQENHPDICSRVTEYLKSRSTK